MAGRWDRGQKPVGQQMSPCCPSTGCLQQAVGTRHRSTAMGAGGCSVSEGQMQSSRLVMHSRCVENVCVSPGSLGMMGLAGRSVSGSHCLH